jgi:integrase
MKQRYQLFKRGWGTFYCLDTTTAKQTSLQTKDLVEAKRLISAKNEADMLPGFNLQIARAYLQASDAEVANRDWQFVMTEIAKTKNGETKHRWETAVKDRNLDCLRNVQLIETRAEHFLKALSTGKPSTNVYLRRIHNFALDMNWIPWSIIPKRQWPKIHYKSKRAITLAEHQRIVEREENPERKAFYRLCWHLGASQGDLAKLHAEDIDWNAQVVSYFRQKTKETAIISFADSVKEILLELPKKGPLFPYLATVRPGDRATEFKQRCDGLNISGVSLHSYRYAWAQRAKECGYPERFAQQALGHNSKAVHRYYARTSVVKIPSLEQYEQEQHARGIVSVNFGAGPVQATEPTASLKLPGKVIATG